MTKGIVASNSDLHLNQNGVKTKEEVQQLIGMLVDFLKENGIRHYIVNGDISWVGEEVRFFREEIVRQFGEELAFYFTNGNHDIAKGNGMTTEEYMSLDSSVDRHLKNHPIVVGDKVVIGMDTLYDYSYYNKELLPDIHLTENVLDEMLAITNKRIFDDAIRDWTHLQEIEDTCIAVAEQQIQQFKGKEIVFVTHYMPKEAFVATNTQQDTRLAYKNAFMGSEKVGEMLERNGVKACYFGHTHRRIFGEVRGITYKCHPVGTEKDWKKYGEAVTLTDGTVIYMGKKPLNYHGLQQKYNPTPAVLRTFVQMVETLEIIA